MPSRTIRFGDWLIIFVLVGVMLFTGWRWRVVSNELENLQDSYTRYNFEIVQLENQLGTVSGRFEQASLANAELIAEYTTLENSIAEHSSEIGLLIDALEAAMVEISLQTDEIDALMSAADELTIQVELVCEWYGRRYPYARQVAPECEMEEEIEEYN